MSFDEPETRSQGGHSRDYADGFADGLAVGEEYNANAAPPVYWTVSEAADLRRRKSSLPVIRASAMRVLMARPGPEQLVALRQRPAALVDALALILELEEQLRTCEKKTSTRSLA